MGIDSETGAQKLIHDQNLIVLVSQVHARLRATFAKVRIVVDSTCPSIIV
jgi:hypothetical protein